MLRVSRALHAISLSNTRLENRTDFGFPTLPHRLLS